MSILDQIDPEGRTPTVVKEGLNRRPAFEGAGKADREPGVLTSAMSAFTSDFLGTIGTGAKGAGFVTGAEAPTTIGEFFDRQSEKFADKDRGIVSDIAGGFGSMAAILPAGVVAAYGGPAAAAVGISSIGFLVGAGEGGERAKEAGLTEDGQFRAAVAGGVTGAILEKFSAAGRVVGHVSGKIMKPGLRRAALFAEELVKGAAAEGITEGLQEVTQDAIQNSYDPDFDFFDAENAKRWMKAAAIGSIVGGTVSGTSVALNGNDTQVFEEGLVDDVELEGEAKVDSTEYIPGSHPDDVGPQIPRPSEIVGEVAGNNPDAVTDREIWRRAVSETAGQLSQEVEARADVTVSGRDVADVLASAKAGNLAQSSKTEQGLLYAARPLMFFRLLDGDSFGPMRRMFYDNASEGYHRFLDRNMDTQRDLQGWFEGRSDDPGYMSKTMDNIKTYNGVELTGAERVGMILASTDPDAMRKIQQDGFVRPDGTEAARIAPHTIAKVLADVTQDEVDLANYMRQRFTRQFPEVQGQFMGLTGQQMEAIEGYFPNVGPAIFEDTQQSMQNAISRAYGAGEGQVEADAAVTKGFTKKRVQFDPTKDEQQGRQRLTLDALHVFAQHTKEVDFFIENALRVKEMRDVANSDAVRDAIKRTYGVKKGGSRGMGLDTHEYLTEWVEAVSRPGPVQNHADFVQNGLRHLRRNAAPALLMAKFGVGMKQTSSTFNAIAEYKDAGAIMSGWMKVVDGFRKGGSLNTDNNPTVIEMEALIPELKKGHRQMEMSLDEFKQQNVRRLDPRRRNRAAKIRKHTQPLLGFITGMDRLTMAGITKGAFDAEMAKHGNRQRAINVARDLALRTQPQSAIKDLTPFQRNPNEIIRAYAVFQNQITQNFNQDAEFGRKLRGKKIEPREAAQFFFFAHVMPTLIMASINAAFAPEEGDIVNEAIKTSPLGTAPIVGSMTNSMLYALDTSDTFANTLTRFGGDVLGLGGPALAGPKKVFRGGAKIAGGKFGAGILDVGVGAGLIAGLPTDAARVAIEGITDAIQGNFDAGDTANAMLFSRYQRRRRPSTEQLNGERLARSRRRGGKVLK